LRDGKRFYFFSLNKEYENKDPCQEGMIYIFPKAIFEQTSKGPIRFDEWASSHPVRPIAKLKVASGDFPFLKNVSYQDEK
jgi:hypothetical protein